MTGPIEHGEQLVGIGIAERPRSIGIGRRQVDDFGHHLVRLSSTDFGWPGPTPRRRAGRQARASGPDGQRRQADRQRTGCPGARPVGHRGLPAQSLSPHPQFQRRWRVHRIFCGCELSRLRPERDRGRERHFPPAPGARSPPSSRRHCLRYRRSYKARRPSEHGSAVHRQA